MKVRVILPPCKKKKITVASLLIKMEISWPVTQNPLQLSSKHIFNFFTYFSFSMPSTRLSVILAPPLGLLTLSHCCFCSGCSCLDAFLIFTLTTPVHAAGGSWNAAGLQEPLASFSPAASISFPSCASRLSILHYNYLPRHQLWRRDHFHCIA